MIELRTGKQSQTFIEWCQKNYPPSSKILVLAKENPESFDKQEHEIVRVLKDPVVSFDNKTSEDILTTFNTIVSTFPISKSLAQVIDFESMETVMKDYIDEKNKSL